MVNGKKVQVKICNINIHIVKPNESWNILKPKTRILSAFCNDISQVSGSVLAVKPVAQKLLCNIHWFYFCRITLEMIMEARVTVAPESLYIYIYIYIYISSFQNGYFFQSSATRTGCEIKAKNMVYFSFLVCQVHLHLRKM